MQLINMKITFSQDLKEQWGNKQAEISNIICASLASKKDFFVEIDKVTHTKSYMQLKGLYKLLSLLAPRLTEINGLPYNIENTKAFVKWNFDYTTLASNEECLAECINEKNKRLTLGVKMSKDEFNKLYATFSGNLKRPKSFADATKEEMIELIEKIEELGRKMNWSEIKLESCEMRDLVEGFNNK